MKIRHSLLFLVLFFSCSFQIHAQHVIQIFTDFGSSGWWASDTTAATLANVARPNDKANLLGFKVGNQVFSTGINDNALISRNINFRAGDYRALPVGTGGGVSDGSTVIGIGKRYNGILQDGTATPPSQPRSFYLTDGEHGLDITTGVFNIPKSEVYYKIDEFSIAAIGDSMPDVIATQMGSYSGPADTFKFIDVNGNVVGNRIVVNFSNVKRVAIQEWAFYDDNVSPRIYNASVSSSAARDTRLIAWDLSAFGLNSGNVGLISRFVHVLSGTSDQAFVAYNTTAFRALQTIVPSCSNTTKPGLWLQANSGLTVAADKASLWSDQGAKGLHVEQLTPALRPSFKEGADAVFNFNPYLDFNNNNWMGHANSPFSAATNNMDVFIVGRATSSADNNKIWGLSRNATDEAGTGRGDYPACNFSNSGRLNLSYGDTTYATAAAASGTLNQPMLWQLNYTQNNNFSVLRNGLADTTGTAAAMALGTWYTRLGDGTPGNNSSDFDIAEMIVFPANNPEQERQKTRSYLAIKYGFSLAESYRSGADDIVWDYTSAATYSNRILGIGREDCQGLYQKQSQSNIDPLHMLTVGLGAIDQTNKKNMNGTANNQYLIWGDNNGSLATTQQVLVKEHCLKHSDRVWRLQRSGTYIAKQQTQVIVHAGEINWDAAAYTGTAANYYLLIDRNSNGAYNDAMDTMIQASTMTNDFVTFNGVQWDNDESGTDLFTIAVKRAEMPVLTISNPAAVCPPATVNITAPATRSASSAGTTLSYYQDASASQPLSTPTAVKAGTYYVKSTDPATGCYLVRPVTVTNNALPIANAGPDMTITTTSVTMAANTPASGESGHWTLVSIIPAGGTVNINNPGAYNTTVNIPRSSSAVLAWTVNNGQCQSSDSVALYNSTPLPVSFTSFTATLLKQDKVLLKWSTAWEHDNSGYEIEKSLNARDYVKIGFEPAKHDHQITGSSFDYSFIDAAANNNVLYYRLRQVNNNGSFSYSNIQAVKQGANYNVQVYPNPVASLLYISNATSIESMQLKDINGKTLCEYPGARDVIDMSLYPAGIYYLLITDTNHYTKPIKLIRL